MNTERVVESFVSHRVRSLNMKGFTSFKELNLGLACLHLIIALTLQEKKSMV